MADSFGYMEGQKTGVIPFFTASGEWKPLGVGTAGQVLGITSGLPVWQTPSTYLAHNLLSATHSDTVAASPTRGDLIVANSTPAWARFAKGSSGQFLKQGANDPAWTNIVATDVGSGAALTKADDTNITLTLGGTPTSALLAAASITVGWTGTLAVSRGGIGVGTLASNGVLYGNGTGAVQALAVNATATNKFARQVSSGAPTWETLVAGDIPSLAASVITSGQVALARGGTNADLSATGGTSQYLKQASAGAAITVGTIAAADLPGSFNGFANPSASAGATAVNGSAATAMRSDGAPAVAFGAFTTYTPTIAAVAGTFTTATAAGHYLLLGKLLILTLTATITTVGSGTGGFTLTLPASLTALTNQSAFGSELVITAKAVRGFILASAGTIKFAYYDNSDPDASSAVFAMTAILEVT